ncbi:hypothetical protein HDF18_17050 [Mucilaginibacter sp. X5P1]|uniref:hypothetical protein n=1 Tax=Mucilaginibacter sp. X5P1 TaxID=2723088 RepID=UPI001607CAB3|nr:hypothetical protein [Mucilaginibacter sp. X5P1]MBB6139345.1 hypothetical protein [Mucilaginibacter sp. X5P1]
MLIFNVLISKLYGYSGREYFSDKAALVFSSSSRLDDRMNKIPKNEKQTPYISPLKPPIMRFDPNLAQYRK